VPVLATALGLSLLGSGGGLLVASSLLLFNDNLRTRIVPWLVNEEFARQYLPPDPIGYLWTYPATATTPAVGGPSHTSSHSSSVKSALPVMLLLSFGHR